MSRTFAQWHKAFSGSDVAQCVSPHEAYWRESARTLAQWAALESLGLVRLRCEPDDDFDPSDYSTRRITIAISADDDEAFGSIGEFVLPRSVREAIDAQPQHPYFNDSEWAHGGSVWGHVGYRNVLDRAENAYIVGIMRETIDAFRDAWKSWIAINRPTPSECAIPTGMLTSARVRRACQAIGDACGITWESAFSIASAIGAKNHDFTGRTPVETEDFRAALELLSRVNRGNLCTKSPQHS